MKPTITRLQFYPMGGRCHVSHYRTRSVCPYTGLPWNIEMWSEGISMIYMTDPLTIYHRLNVVINTSICEYGANAMVVVEWQDATQILRWPGCVRDDMMIRNVATNPCLDWRMLHEMFQSGSLKQVKADLPRLEFDLVKYTNSLLKGMHP